MATGSIDRRQAHSFLASLRAGDAVILTRDGRDLEVTVQRTLRGQDGGGFGSWDHSAVTVGYGPGRFNQEVTPAGIEFGNYSLRRAGA